MNTERWPILFTLQLNLVYNCKHMSSINSEWLRKPMSQMEKTLRFPYLIKIAIGLFLAKTAPKWLVLSYIFWFFIKNPPLSAILGFLSSLIWEMFTLRDWYRNKAFPTHKNNMAHVRNVFGKLDSFTISELVEQIDVVAQKSAWNMVHSGYLILPSWGWEIVFKILYPFLVSNKSIPYQNLLIGFNNKTVEADQKFWEVSQEKDISTQKKQLEQYLEEYGSRVDDLDIALPTLRERPKAVDSLLALSKISPSPKSRFASARVKREHSLKQVKKQLRIPPSAFNGLVEIVQKNVSLREDRRFYEFQADYYLRQMLLSLAKRISIPDVKLFNMSWKEVKNAAYR